MDGLGPKWWLGLASCGPAQAEPNAWNRDREPYSLQYRVERDSLFITFPILKDKSLFRYVVILFLCSFAPFFCNRSMLEA